MICNHVYVNQWSLLCYIINNDFDKFLIQEVSLFKNGYVARLEGKVI
jgi:hypothetical protein